MREKFAPGAGSKPVLPEEPPFQGLLASDLEQLKNRLLARELRETPYPEFGELIRQAADEAAGLAWLTPFPLLVFPCLFEEKAHAAVKRGLFQERVRQRSLELLAKAA